MSVAEVFIDEQDVTGYAVEGSSTRRLNRPSDASVRLPMENAIGDVGSLLKIYFDGVLHHHGRVLLCETDADENGGYTVYNSTDPFELWRWRPVRYPAQTFTSSCGTSPSVNDPGNFSLPDKLLTDFLTGPEMVEAMMYASEDIGLGADDAEGPLFMVGNSFECGGVDLSGVPVDWPMTMAQFATLLVSTGEVDIVNTPIELDGNGNYGQLDVYNGRHGDDLSSSVLFQYGFGAFNIRAFRWNRDITNMTNKLWYFLGPKCDLEHWQANITGTAGGIGNPTFWSECGLTSDQATQWDAWHDNIVTETGTDAGSPGDSRGDFGVRMDIRIFDAVGDQTACVVGTEPLGYCFYKKMWLEEQWLRLQPQNLVHITPTRDAEIGTFDIGDLVWVECVPAVRGGFAGAQRIYEYTISWDAQDSVPALSELQVSGDNEGFDS